MNKIKERIITFFSKDKEKNDNVVKIEDKEITIEDVPLEVRQQLENEFYRSFDFMKLYQPAEETSSIINYVILGGVVLNIIISFI